MNTFLLPIFPDSLNQIQTLQVPLSGGTRSLRVQLRFLEAPALWFLSVWDSVSGDLLVNSIPVRNSDGAINDLLKPFRHLKLGSLCCFPHVEDKAGNDPGKDDLMDYDLIWTERFSL